MKLSVRIDGLGSRIGRAAKRISDAARFQSVRRARAAASGVPAVQPDEGSHVVSQPRSSGGDPRGAEH